jgi:hypothetical protein
LDRKKITHFSCENRISREEIQLAALPVSGQWHDAKFSALLTKNWTVVKRHWTFLLFFATLPLVNAV